MPTHNSNYNDKKTWLTSDFVDQLNGSEITNQFVRIWSVIVAQNMCNRADKRKITLIQFQLAVRKNAYYTIPIVAHPYFQLTPTQKFELAPTHISN